ncbi:MAG: class A beta-lactamase-related serine hydrolase [Pedobacter sp.]|nr:MAG: class A beta-lactamase-related serine hydrolase [Pedobacter sp.]
MKKLLILCLLSLVTTKGFSQYFNTRLDSLFQVLKKKDKFMGSIAVSRNGKIIYTNAIGYSDLATNKPATTLTKYRIGSISKMFTATLIFKAIEEKKLSLNLTIDRYFPQIENSKKITIENLLNHSSGIHNFTDDDDYLTYNTQPKTEKQMVELITKGKSDFEPNSKAKYSNANYVLLSYILQKAYKKDYASILNEKIIKPLKLKNTYFGNNKTNIQNNESYSYHFKSKWLKEDETDPSVPMGAGALIATPTDLTIFINSLFDQKLVSQKSLALMKTIKNGYGMGLFDLSHAGIKSYGHDGAIDRFQSIVAYYPEQKLSIAISSNGAIYKNQNILACAESSYFNTPFEIPTFESMVVSSALLDTYAGTYTSEQIPIKIEVSKNGNQLVAKANGQAALPLEATSTTVFKFDQAGIVLEFSPANKQMTLKQGGKEFLFKK